MLLESFEEFQDNQNLETNKNIETPIDEAEKGHIDYYAKLQNYFTSRKNSDRLKELEKAKANDKDVIKLYNRFKTFISNTNENELVESYSEFVNEDKYMRMREDEKFFKTELIKLIKRLESADDLGSHKIEEIVSEVLKELKVED